MVGGTPTTSQLTAGGFNIVNLNHLLGGVKNYDYLCSVIGFLKNIWCRKKEIFYEWGIPVLLTAIWFAAILYSIFSSTPSSEKQSMISVLNFTLGLFFLEFFIHCIDFAHQQEKHHITHHIFYYVIALAGAFLIWFFLGHQAFEKDAPLWIVILVGLAVCIPKFVSCDLSHNPRHYTKTYSQRKQKSEKPNKVNASAIKESIAQPSPNRFSDEDHLKPKETEESGELATSDNISIDPEKVNEGKVSGDGASTVSNDANEKPKMFVNESEQNAGSKII